MAGGAFHNGRIQTSGNLYRDPKQISKEGSTLCVVATIAMNYRTSNDVEGVFPLEMKFFAEAAERILESWKQGDNVFVTGRLEGREWEDKEGNIIHQMVVLPDEWGHSGKWHVTEQHRSSGGRSRHRSDEDETERPARRTRRSTRREVDHDDHEDENKASEEEERPRARRSRRTTSRSDSGRSRPAVTNYGDDDDDDHY